jgi:hypothetical protein
VLCCSFFIEPHHLFAWQHSDVKWRLAKPVRALVATQHGREERAVVPAEVDRDRAGGPIPRAENSSESPSPTPHASSVALGTMTPKELPMRRILSRIRRLISRYNIGLSGSWTARHVDSS